MTMTLCPNTRDERCCFSHNCCGKAQYWTIIKYDEHIHCRCEEHKLTAIFSEACITFSLETPWDDALTLGALYAAD